MAANSSDTKSVISGMESESPLGRSETSEISTKELVPYAFFGHASGQQIGYLLPFLDCFEGVTEYQTSTFPAIATCQNAEPSVRDFIGVPPPRVHPSLTRVFDGSATNEQCGGDLLSSRSHPRGFPGSPSLNKGPLGSTYEDRPLGGL